MSRYIDADKIKAYLHREDFYTPDERWKPESEFANIVDAVPTADVEEVRHGEWKAKEHISTSGRNRKIHYATFRCSECKKWNGTHRQNYCPNCGAKMDGERRTDNDLLRLHTL